MLNAAILEVTTGLQKVVTIILSNLSSPVVYEFGANISVRTRQTFFFVVK